MVFEQRSFHDSDMIQIVGAALHNLEEVSVDIPRGALTACTGVSGSGKSSLAFGTLYEFSSRRFFETISPYARTFLPSGEHVPVHSIKGVPPGVALRQAASGAGANSTVGSVTGLSNTLRLLWSRCGHYPSDVPVMYSDAFNPASPQGACPGCSGKGVVYSATEQSLVPDPSLSIREGAIASWPGAWMGKNLRDIVRTLGHDIDKPWRELPQRTRQWLLHTDEEPVVTVQPQRDAGRVQRDYQGQYFSAEKLVLRTLGRSASEAQRRKARSFVESTPCASCAGTGLKAESLSVKWPGAQGMTITEATGVPIDSLLDIAQTERAGHDASDAQSILLDDVLQIAKSVHSLGLHHLTADTAAGALSTGESRRLQLSSVLRGDLFGVLYVLDEPATGSSGEDVRAIIDALRALVDAGNTVIVVEHNEDVIQACDWVVDLGPGAGKGGGQIVYSGPRSGFEDATESITASYLRDPVRPADVRAGSAREPRGNAVLAVRSATTTRHLTVGYGQVTVLEGPSGSGKSETLDAISACMAQHVTGIVADDSALSEDPTAPRIHADLVEQNGDAPTRLVHVSGAPIGRTPRSCVATYTGLLDPVRKAFAATSGAKAAGFSVSRFSFNTQAGRCPQCEGLGQVMVELMFLPSTWQTCPSCQGARYNPETLEVTWNGMTIADVLALTAEQAIEELAQVPAAARIAGVLTDIGLGYLPLGMGAPGLSGGEARRVKLSAACGSSKRGHDFYTIDDPSAGLHPADVHRLLAHLHRLADRGHTVVVADHHRITRQTADCRIVCSNERVR